MYKQAQHLCINKHNICFDDLRSKQRKRNQEKLWTHKDVDVAEACLDEDLDVGKKF